MPVQLVDGGEFAKAIQNPAHAVDFREQNLNGFLRVGDGGTFELLFQELGMQGERA
jgi:hypothetical protein